MTPRWPLYVVSKGRYQRNRALTIRALVRMGVPFRVVVEGPEVADYRALLAGYGRHGEDVLELPPRYKEQYELCDDLGLTKSTGPGPARNFAWDHAWANEYDWHWVMDDNIGQFFRFNRNLKVPVVDGTIFRCMEDFCERYDNVAMAGPNYFMFVVRKERQPPFVPNTRIYSCNLIRNDVPFRWRGRYNEDTILSLDMMKAGWCTVQFNAFIQEKMPTQIIAGGNTTEFYAKEGTLPKSKMLEDVHPDVSRVVWKFGRWHHEVDYRHFRRHNKLRRRPDVVLPEGTNDYGMVLEQKIGESWYRIDDPLAPTVVDELDGFDDLDLLLDRRSVRPYAGTSVTKETR